VKYSINLDDAEFINLVNLSLGLYSPLKGFNTKKETENIILHKKINNKNQWTFPILLNAKKKIILSNKEYFLIYRGNKVGIIKVNSLFKIDKKKFCKKVFNTNSINHPTVRYIYNSPNNYISGDIKVFKNYFKKDKNFGYNIFKINNKTFSNSAVFTTRNICHLGHEHIHKKIIKSNKKLLICIIQSEKNKFDPDLVIKSYRQLKNKKKLYKNIQIIKIYLPLLMAGPKEAFLQAVYLNNLKCKYFIVGRDHAGFNNNYKKYDSQKIFNKLRSLKIKIIKTNEPFLCNNCKTVYFSNTEKCRCKLNLNKSISSIDGKVIKKLLLQNNFDKVGKFLSSEVASFCLKNIKKIKKFKG